MDKEKPQKSGIASLASFPEELETIMLHMESKEIRPRDPKYDPLPAVPRITDEGSTHVYEDLNSAFNNQSYDNNVHLYEQPNFPEDDDITLNNSNSRYARMEYTPTYLDYMITQEPAKTVLNQCLATEEMVKQALDEKHKETGMTFTTPGELVAYLCVMTGRTIYQMVHKQEEHLKEIGDLLANYNKLNEHINPPTTTHSERSTQHSPENVQSPREKYSVLPEAIKFQLIFSIKAFEGKKDRTFSEFATEFKQLMPNLVRCDPEGRPATLEDERDLVRYILMRIRGSALECLNAISVVSYETTSQLWADLSLLYSPYVDSKYYLMKLKHLKQGELSVSELASEVLRLSSRAIESYTDSCYKDINRHPAMLKTAYDSLWISLKKDILLQLFPIVKKIYNFHQLVHEARKVEFNILTLV